MCIVLVGCHGLLRAGAQLLTALRRNDWCGGRRGRVSTDCLLPDSRSVLRPPQSSGQHPLLRCHRAGGRSSSGIFGEDVWCHRSIQIKTTASSRLTVDVAPDLSSSVDSRTHPRGSNLVDWSHPPYSKRTLERSERDPLSTRVLLSGPLENRHAYLSRRRVRPGGPPSVL